MKVIFKIIIPILTLFVLMSACSANVAADNLSPETTSESLSPSPLSDNVDMYKSEVTNLYQGEILYVDIPILQFMGADISEVIDVLGEPLDVASRPPSTDVAGIYVYDRLYFHVDDNTPIGYITMSPDVCEIDGVSLDKNRDELISMLGVPNFESFDEEGEFSNYLLLDYEIQGYWVRFCLETSDEKASWMEIYKVDTDTVIYSELEALNLVKNYIAGGDDSIFEPLSSSDSLTYKYRNSNYMIQYDSIMNDQYHLIHEYEFVIDDPESGEGHTSTGNWYQVDIFTGEIIPMFNDDGSMNENY